MKPTAEMITRASAAYNAAPDDDGAMEAALDAALACVGVPDLMVKPLVWRGAFNEGFGAGYRRDCTKAAHYTIWRDPSAVYLVDDGLATFDGLTFSTRHKAEQAVKADWDDKILSAVARRDEQ